MDLRSQFRDLTLVAAFGAGLIAAAALPMKTPPKPAPRKNAVPLFTLAVRHFEPRARIRSIRWMRDHAHTDRGRPFDHGAYPYLGAPGGPCDALDDPSVRTIALQWASRCGKTQFGAWAQQFLADTQPGPMMFVAPDEKLAIEITERQYQSLGHNPRLRGQLLPERLRHKTQIVLRACRVYVAWPRSVSTLADKSIRWGHGTEIDKWVYLSTSLEAEPLELFLERFKDYPTHKKVLDSTPTIEGKSRIERLRLASTNCRFEAPCPHCQRYQPLVFGKPDAPGGIRWDRVTVTGAHDKEIARRTGHYLCRHCAEKIWDHHRAPMLRRGVWCPEGCTVIDAQALELTDLVPVAGDSDSGATVPRFLSDEYEWRGWNHAAWVEGAPANDGPDAGYQLSSLCALSVGFGDVAAKFVRAKDQPAELQNFVNGWLAETWERRSRKQSWEQLGARLIDPDLKPGVCPAWSTLLTLGVDRQERGFPYVLKAWGEGRRSAAIAYGLSPSLADIREHLIEPTWPHADGKAPLRVAMTLVDSGFRPEGIYEFSRACLLSRPPLQVWPSKGSSNSLNADWRQSTLGKDTSAPGMRLFWIDTVRTQGWIDRVLHELARADPGGFSLFAGSLQEHQDYLEQLLNDAPTISPDGTHEIWDRVVESIPNDYRDCERQAYVAMLIVTRGAPILARDVQLASASQGRGARDEGRVHFTTPDGRPFLISDRGRG